MRAYPWGGDPFAGLLVEGGLLLLLIQSEHAMEKVMEKVMEYWEIGLAVYAALMATGVFIIEIRQWLESRPRVFLKITTDLAMPNNTEGIDKIMSVSVTNRGSVTTTIQNMFTREYDSWWQRTFTKKTVRLGAIFNAKFPNSNEGELPHAIQPGAEWRGMLEQTSELETKIANGRVYVSIYFTHKDKPITKRIKRKKYAQEMYETLGKQFPINIV